MPRAFPTVDESLAHLHSAGWSVGDVRLLTPSGARWLVSGANGENAIKAEGVSQAEAWARALYARHAAQARGLASRPQGRTPEGKGWPPRSGRAGAGLVSE